MGERGWGKIEISELKRLERESDLLLIKNRKLLNMFNAFIKDLKFAIGNPNLHPIEIIIKYEKIVLKEELK